MAFEGPNTIICWVGNQPREKERRYSGKPAARFPCPVVASRSRYMTIQSRPYLWATAKYCLATFIPLASIFLVTMARITAYSACSIFANTLHSNAVIYTGRCIVSDLRSFPLAWLWTPNRPLPIWLIRNHNSETERWRWRKILDFPDELNGWGSFRYPRTFHVFICLCVCLSACVYLRTLSLWYNYHVSNRTGLIHLPFLPITHSLTLDPIRKFTQYVVFISKPPCLYCLNTRRLRVYITCLRCLRTAVFGALVTTCVAR